MSKLTVRNPATGKVLAEFEQTSAQQVAAAFESARAAQPAWAALPLARRIDIVRAFRDAIVGQTERLATTLTAEVGKPIAQSRNELDGLLGRIDFFVEHAGAALADQQVHHDGGMRELIVHEPLGVVANISAWNYPYFVGGNVFVPALLAGNAVLYKPSEYAALTGQHIARLLHEAGVPQDVFALLIGGGEVGTALLEQRIDGVFFTGSHATGQRIAQSVATRMVKLQLELGGKDPIYVRDDVEVGVAAASIADGAMYNTGQSCCSVERVYVHERVHDAFVDRFVETVKGFKVGDPMDDGTYIGPLTRAAQLDVLDAQVADAKAKGAVLHTGGQRLAGPGAWYAPTVFSRVTHDMELMREESFGPDHRHPESVGRRRSGGADERHALRPHGGRLHARRGARAGAARARERRQRVLELLRPREPAPAVVGSR